MTPTIRPREFVSLADRLQTLQLVRLALALALIVVLLVADTSAHAHHVIVISTIAYAGLTSVVEAARRRARVRGLVIVTTLLLIDAGLLSFASTVTGGPTSPLVFLALVSVVATVLLLSSRAGLQLAVWYAFLLAVAHVVALTGMLGPTVLRAEQTSSSRAGLNAALVLLAAAIAAGCSAINERALRRRRAELAALVELGYELGSAHEPDEILHQLVSHVRRMEFRRVALVHYSADRATAAVATATVTETFDVTTTAGRVPTGHPEPRLVRRLDHDHPLRALLPRARNVVVVELAVDDRPIGIIGAETEPGRSRLPAATLSALVESAAHGALALHNAALRREVEQLATRDALTGVANRRVFDDTLRRECERHARTGTRCALILLDVDHFKRINDTHGHQAGDSVLAQIGRALRDICRDADLPARYGGEEFVVLLTDCDDAAQALATGERIRAAITHTVTTVPITVSAGLACVPTHGTTPGDLVRAADAALYAAKRAGRNQSVMADPALHADGVAYPAAPARANYSVVNIARMPLTSSTRPTPS